jgi:tetratricopeptide (TPR) repeat protein
MENSQNTASSFHWLDITEKIAVISSISGSIICVFLQKSLYASLPISASLALNLLNRQRLLKIKEQNSQTNLSALIQEHQNHLDIVEKSFQAKNSELATKIENLSKLTKEETATIKNKVQKLQKSLFELDKVERDLDTGLNDLNQQQIEINKLVQELRIFGNQTPNIASETNSASFYYNKGLIYQDNNNLEQAVANYSKAIELDNNYALAYHYRGLIYIEIAEKRKALEDLRKASQLYFNNQDLDSYHHARNLTQKLHELKNTETIEEKIAVNKLFS